MAGYTPGFHEGSRSEYLAQYVFSSFGTASAIPHQEDHGFDLYCTLAQEAGRVAWADKPYSVQVKSDGKPWAFKNRESVEWFVRHPLPLFLCVVDKENLRLKVFQTGPKYYYWALNLALPDQLSLHPDMDADEGKCSFWHESANASLGAAIADFTLEQLKDDDFFRRIRAVLDGWLDVEYANLFQITAGVRLWTSPDVYKTNTPIAEYAKGTGYQSGPVDSLDQLKGPLAQMRHGVGWVLEQSLRLGDSRGALRAALFLHHFCPDRPYTPSYVSTFSHWLNREWKMPGGGYVHKALEAIAARIDSEISVKREG